ncbi:LysR family transcriptional regulator [Micromonospora sp. 4G55]|uniref:LysR family transcriptional regulator n=1 Tax=Micromonospora sp. 4G55 TaxID=2806102 RepID=UPI001A4A46C7|nr:LysR family transcriptional regulator [Micromonospora sp. 4G55]MBM0256847.1 LysR family transcriptional regulator [Micromonospora sp. 4G55]
MKVSLDLLRSFLAVHRSGSITAAAELLGLAQPTVTAQIRALEEAVGRPLFDRVPRGVLPTPAGDELARRVADPLDRLDAVLADDTATPYPRTVFLGGRPSSSRSWRCRRWPVWSPRAWSCGSPRGCPSSSWTTLPPAGSTWW